MEKTLNMILAEQKRQGDLLHQLIHAVAGSNVKITEMDEKISKMNGKMTEMDGRIAEMDERITQTNEKVTELNGKVISIENKLDSVFEEVKEIKVKMASKHDLEYYDQMISEHSREIYKLKNH
ncbi:hypothetical protein [Neobacillus sp. DY30]|uniref:hypothetical protein n=1 Tax=Neobacillus sp. DY30 TaxID=3047871 RepID=UPI0024C0B3D8|nr:hypothetical protein [Neobacillus sp. DY30]WHY03307.1 hypothetical protein QNH29_14245 [Neobacillus sp. DY30]